MIGQFERRCSGSDSDAELAHEEQMMDTKETKLTATQLARSLSDVLNRVQYNGERFVIERNGQVVATLQPSAVTRKGPTLEEFLKALEHAPRLDDEFEHELREIRAAQPPMQVREWPE
jgi:hypothetical protein